MYRKIRVFAILTMLTLCFRAESQPALPPGSVDIFMGVDFHYRDIMFRKVYEVCVNLTPSVKWNMGNGWQTSAQVLVPVLNDYGKYYGRVKLNVAAVSKEMYFGDRWFLKASGGLFTKSRYGLDVKSMYVVRDWLAFEGQLGLTGHCYVTSHWEAGYMKTLTGTLGADFYLTKWDTQFRVRGGRYVYTDYGMTVDVMRHFKHCSVGLYGSLSTKGRDSAGFQVVVMLPPYKRTLRKVNFRPASNFNFTYTFYADDYTNERYCTDPEENDRQGWFDTNRLKWGVNATHTDFEYKEKEKKAKAEVADGKEVAAE